MKKAPSPCCVPSKERAVLLEASRQASAERQRAERGSTSDMVHLDGGCFLMGTDSDEAFPADGEGPIRKVILDPFYMDRYPVTNRSFSEFIEATGYTTEAERFGWSFVFRGHIAPEDSARLVEDTVQAAPWWCKVRKADWRHPEGPDTTVAGRENYPVVHVSWHDANEFATMGREAAADRSRMGIRGARRSRAKALSLGRRANAGRPTPLQHLARRVSGSGHGRGRILGARAGGRVSAKRIWTIHDYGERVGMVRGLVQPDVSRDRHALESGRTDARHIESH